MEIKRVREIHLWFLKTRDQWEIKKIFPKALISQGIEEAKKIEKKMLEDIKKKGDRLAVTKCYSDVKAYKNLIKEYLTSVLNHMYSVKKDISFWQTQYFLTVDAIDEKLQELTEMLLSNEKENLEIARTIDEIAGLVVDIYK